MWIGDFYVSDTGCIWDKRIKRQVQPFWSHDGRLVTYSTSGIVHIDDLKRIKSRVKSHLELLGKA